MKNKILFVVWGLVILAFGVLLLADENRFFNQTPLLGITFKSPAVVIAFLGGLSVLFFITYFLHGVRKWGWLFPALIFASLSITEAINQSVPWDSAVRFNTVFIAFNSGLPILVSIAIPLIVCYALDVKKNWWAIIPAGILLTIALVNPAFLPAADPGFQTRFNPLGYSLVSAGLAATFAFLWFRRKFHSTAWAIYPAFGLAATAVLPILMPRDMDFFWPVVLLAGGTILLSYGFTRDLDHKNRKAI